MKDLLKQEYPHRNSSIFCSLIVLYTDWEQTRTACFQPLGHTWRQGHRSPVIELSIIRRYLKTVQIVGTPRARNLVLVRPVNRDRL